MVAMTPFVINFLIRSIGLFSILSARSRITMLAGNSILFPLLLISHLLLVCESQFQDPRNSQFSNKRPVSKWLFVHMAFLAGLCTTGRVVMRQSFHKIFQS